MLNSNSTMALSFSVHFAFALVANVYKFEIGGLLPAFVLVGFLSSLSLSVSALLSFGPVGLKKYLLSRGVGDVSITSQFLILLFLTAGMILFLATVAVPIRCEFRYLDGCYSNGISEFAWGMTLVGLVAFLLWVVLEWLQRFLRK
ncbi:hypothetical protein [Maricaulis sp.]|uniref:hypothetical protein n=1 Tax=Maricaulis sp. TaxID=1486257 RepID=UPI0025EDC1BC|nr:hypothetical protein [Maricaulis sp.]MDF1767495.1 hypothetical protein [Maricaulis sp.]